MLEEETSSGHPMIVHGSGIQTTIEVEKHGHGTFVVGPVFLPDVIHYGEAVLLVFVGNLILSELFGGYYRVTDTGRHHTADPVRPDAQFVRLVSDPRITMLERIRTAVVPAR